MRPRELWRTTPFRLTLLNGAVFAVAVMALLGMIYWRTAGYMSRQLDAIVVAEARALASGDPAGLPQRVRDSVAVDSRAVSFYGLFAADGTPIAGNVSHLPRGAVIDGAPRDLPEAGFQPGARALVERLPSGRILLVAHDAKVLSGLREIIVNALVVSGAAILLLGLAAAALLSLAPLLHTVRGSGYALHAPA